MLRNKVLTRWSNDWRKLKTWQRDLSKVTIKISDREFPDRLGSCWPHQQRIIVYSSGDIVTDLDTIVHELAHVDAPRSNHGEAWQIAYTSAIRHITKIPTPATAHNFRILCDIGEAALRSWWNTSGNEFAYKLLKGKAA